MVMSLRVRQRGAILAIAVLILSIGAAVPFMGQAQDATPAVTEDELIQRGEDIYSNVCIACHQPGGKGIQGIYPPLNGNPLITGEDPTYVIETVLTGRGGMPRFNRAYDNVEIASVITYVRQAWDNDAAPVSPEQVAEVRDQIEAEPEGATPTPEGQIPSDIADEGMPADATPEATPGT